MSDWSSGIRDRINAENIAGIREELRRAIQLLTMLADGDLDALRIARRSTEATVPTVTSSKSSLGITPKRLRFKQAAKYLGVGTPKLTQWIAAETFTVQTEGAQDTRYLMVDELDYFLGDHPENGRGDAGEPESTRMRMVKEFRKRKRRTKR